MYVYFFASLNLSSATPQFKTSQTAYDYLLILKEFFFKKKKTKNTTQKNN